MNSLSILSSTVDKVIGNTPPSTPHPDFEDLRRGYIPSLDEKLHDALSSESDQLARLAPVTQGKPGGGTPGSSPAIEDDSEDEALASRLVSQSHGKTAPETSSGVVRSLWRSRWCGCFRWAFSSVGKTLEWAIGSVYNERGEFSAVEPLRRMAWLVIGRKTIQNRRRRRSSQMAQSSNPKFELTVEGEDTDQVTILDDYGSGGGADMRRIKSTSGSSGTRSSASTGSGGHDILPRRSIRIRLYNEERTHQKTKSTSVKSPTSPSASLRMTKYPRMAGPPAPLLSHKPSTKTLILDLDETLIHSLAKGGRMSSGHMVEVKLDRQHAILYYVHKRPYCDEFLRKVAKWYNLVIFTASVQEYADPVIDWLEQDRKYFSGRYYRQHCTNRNGAYIKDISTVEPDLSKVMILDNSPMSYIFHEDNAIPIEGWINDPTDLDLMNLIPLLQALHYVADVRALLALRMGEL